MSWFSAQSRLCHSALCTLSHVSAPDALVDARELERARRGAAASLDACVAALAAEVAAMEGLTHLTPTDMEGISQRLDTMRSVSRQASFTAAKLHGAVACLGEQDAAVAAATNDADADADDAPPPTSAGAERPCSAV